MLSNVVSARVACLCAGTHRLAHTTHLELLPTAQLQLPHKIFAARILLLIIHHTHALIHKLLRLQIYDWTTHLLLITGSILMFNGQSSYNPFLCPLLLHLHQQEFLIIGIGIVKLSNKIICSNSLYFEFTSC
jgi:hypothetical protein